MLELRHFAHIQRMFCGSVQCALDNRPPGSSGVLLVQSLCANMEIIGATNIIRFAMLQPLVLWATQSHSPLSPQRMA
jgi:hypothetical protein